MQYPMLFSLIGEILPPERMPFNARKQSRLKNKSLRSRLLTNIKTEMDKGDLPFTCHVKVVKDGAQI